MGRKARELFYVRVLFSGDRDDLAFHLPSRALGGVALGLTAWGAASGAMADVATDADSASPTDVTGVVVTGVRPLMGDRIPLAQQDTPQSVNVVPQKLLTDQGVTRLEDALRNVPGITLNAGEGAARGDTVNIRGFSAFNDFFLDGIRDAAVYDRDTFDTQTLEVLKGPSATLFGRGSTGGAINQVTKAPTLEAARQIVGEIGSNDEYRGALDIDQPLSSSSALRINAMGESSSLAGRAFVENRRWGFAPALAFGIGAPTTVTLTYLHLQEDNRPDTGVPFVNGAPAPVPRGADFGLLSDRNKSNVDIGTFLLQHDFNDTVSLQNTFRAAAYSFSYISNAPNFGSVAAGGQGAPTLATPLANILVGRDSPASAGQQTNITDQLDVTLRFATGPVTHVLVVGTELAKQTNDLERYVNPFNSNNNWIPETPLLDPNPNMVRPFEPISSAQDTDADSEAIYLTDTMKLGDHLDFIAGVRLDRFAAAYHQVSLTSGAVLDLNHTDVVGSPRVSLVYKPAANTSLYASYGTSFDPSAEALSLTTKTANLGPVKATTYEVGGKSTVLGGGLLVTGALFHTEVDNAQTNDPANPTVTVLNGNLRVQGFELGASGHIGPNLEITAGYTYLDGKTLASGQANTVGKEIFDLAHNAANVWAEYHITPKWQVGFGGNYLDRRFADPANTARVPAYTVLNAMTSYKLTPNLSLQLNAINLTNKLYYDAVYFTSASENHALPGAGRTVKLTVRAKF
jgi:catecholate siderophore receptor